jgi:hypothetical protein
MADITQDQNLYNDLYFAQFLSSLPLIFINLLNFITIFLTVFRLSSQFIAELIRNADRMNSVKTGQDICLMPYKTLCTDFAGNSLKNLCLGNV